MAAIQKTSDYKQFKFLDCNRPIVKNHVDRLRMSIEMNNLLHLRPIMVNENMEIIDGQHRLAAAEQLNIPVYYIVDKKISDNDLIDINNIQRNWSMLDYYNYWLNKGKEEYIKLRDLTLKLNCSVDYILSDLIKAEKVGKLFKAGLFKLNPDIDHFTIYSQFEEIKDMICNYLPRDKRLFIYTRSFRRAVLVFINREDVNFQLFKKKIELNISRLKRCPLISDYLELFAFIYNYRNQNPIES